MMETMAFRHLSSASDLGTPKSIKMSQTSYYAKPAVFRRLPRQHKMMKVVVNVQKAPKLVNGFSKPKGTELFETSWVNESGLKDISGLAENGFNRAGRLIEGRMVYREKFFIRSYEVGADMTGSIETVFNLLQESAVNHAYVGGVCRDGFGSTHEMARLNLIWVVTRMQVQVDRYPCWGNVVEIDTWIASSGKNSMRRDWLVRDSETGSIIARATSTWVMMNKETRKLMKFPEAVKKEICPYYLERSAIAQTDVKKLEKIAEGSAQYVLSGLTPKWRDLDTNCHVNNVKYVGWVLESVPVYILESHELASITLEFRRECGQSHVIQSLTSVDNDEASSDSTSAPGVSHCSGVNKKCLNALHLLRLQDSRVELVRGRTEWRSKTRNIN
ncbi:hypothetical protein SUGI_1185970 [Cryptomeria japonica]|nr:hypothetical protein SUGI_1185970 [Cryptomeria japonica]